MTSVHHIIAHIWIISFFLVGTVFHRIIIVIDLSLDAKRACRVVTFLVHAAFSPRFIVRQLALFVHIWPLRQ